MKLFFENNDPDGYAELYVNINEKEQWIELREKDEGYRRQVTKFLTAKRKTGSGCGLIMYY